MTSVENGLMQVLLPALSGLVGATIGVFAAHLLTSRRDVEQKRREFALKYLVDAWQTLELTSRDGVDLVRRSHAMEKACADIQLFGSPAQILLADRFAKDMTAVNSSDTTGLLQELQNDLRRELRLEKSPIKLFFLRIVPKNPEYLKRYNER